MDHAVFRGNSRTCRCILAAMTVFIILSMAPAFAEDNGQAARVEWLDYENGLAKAKKDGRFIVLDFYTSWCRDCKKMDKDTFSDQKVADRLKDSFVAIKVDGDQRPELTSGYGVFAYPTLWLLAPDGSRICQRIGYMSPAEFVGLLDYAESGAYKDTSFNDYVRARASQESMK